LNRSREASGHANIAVVIGRREECPLTKGKKTARVECVEQIGSISDHSLRPRDQDGEAQLRESDETKPRGGGGDEELCPTVTFGGQQALLR
jgi:hypothetical protein